MFLNAHRHSRLARLQTLGRLAGATALILCAPRPATAQLQDVIWEPVETIDVGVGPFSAVGGAAAVEAEGVWHLVYEKNGEVWHAARDGGAWSPPDPVSSSGGSAEGARIARVGTAAVVVWQDARTGRPETWSRALASGQWGAEECLSEDAIDSRAPTICGGETVLGEAVGLVAWEDGAAGASSIVARTWSAGGWAPVEPLSPGFASAAQASAAYEPETDRLSVVWSDTRHGLAEIYARRALRGQPWDAEIRLTDLPWACTRPTVATSTCCSDMVSALETVVFEADEGGVAEIWSACTWLDWVPTETARLSDDDGIASSAPSGSMFRFVVNGCGYGGVDAVTLVSWTEATGGHELRRYEMCGDNGTAESIATGIADGAVAAGAGHPDAPVLFVWVEEQGGEPALVARTGAALACYEVGVGEVPDAILVAPEGLPENLLQVLDLCANEPPEFAISRLVFSEEIDQALHWDPLQPHPETDWEQPDQDGFLRFGVRAGGCVDGGLAIAYCHFMQALWSWPGVKSPDIDGNCEVDPEDLAYIEARLGSDDFCADLDGDGVVGEGDLAIVTATLGDRCSHIVSGVEGADPAMSARVRVSPNPAAGAVRLHLSGAAADPACEIRIVDAGGRIVRVLRGGDAAAGNGEPSGVRGGSVVWDGMNASGRPVAAGVYLAAIRGERGAWSSPIVVVR